MIDNINALLTSWYLSPPWGQTIPPVAVKFKSPKSSNKYLKRLKLTLMVKQKLAFGQVRDWLGSALWQFSRP